MNRREWLKLSAAGVAASGTGLWPTGSLAQAVCDPCNSPLVGVPAKSFHLEIGDTRTRMVDGEMVNQLAYRLASAQGAWRVPGPTLRVKEGSLIEVKVTNTRKEAHGFEITGIPGTRTEVDPGCSCTVRFVAPVGGTYIFHDPTGDTPLYRILGLHGVLVVEPMFGTTKRTVNNPYPSRTPYSLDKLTTAQRNTITKLFDALGMTSRFMGGANGKWVPAAESEEFANQEKIWILSEIDPRLNALVQPGVPLLSDPSLTSDIVNTFKPRYFALLNRSGYDLHSGQDICPDNYIGEPTVIRMVNVGLAHHAMHTHGNHWLRLAQANLADGTVDVADNIFEVDIVAMWPMERRDVLLPFEVPQDIPYKRVDTATPGPTQFEDMVKRRAQEPFPLRYVVHDHVEMGTTAAGGNYPQGMVTHWELMGGLGGRAAQQASLR